MIRIGCAMLIGGCVLCYFGGQDLYTAFRNFSPTSMTCAEYEAQRPAAEWLELRDCVAQVSELAWFEESGRPVRAYLPLQTPGTMFGHQTPVVLATEDDHILDLIDRSDGGDESATEELFAMGRAPGTFSGLVEFGATLEDDDRRQVASMSSGVVTPDFAILDAGEEPSFVMGALKLLGGLGLIAVVGFFLLAGAGREGGAAA